jgi:CheY-like chemotaxis protein
MLFADSGRGMPADFAQHYALEPFNQQDPLDDGIGLGLSLVRNAIQALDGEMSLDTDTKTGTRVSITLPRSKLTLRSSLTRESFLQDFVTDNEHEYLGKTARLFEPGLWTDPHNARHVRCRRSLIASLSCTLRSWLKIDLNVWKSDDELPTYFIVFYADLDRMREEVGVAFEESQKIVICPSSLAQATLSPADLGVFAALTSPLTPSKLCAAISTVSRNSQKQSITSYTCRNQNISKGQQTTLEANPVQSEALAATGELRQYYKTPIVKSDESARTFIEHALSNEPVLHPRLLLVDDNAINLKVISMYAKKCSKGPFVLAGGGQQAIDLFNDASVISGNQRSSGFEIVVLDLSMPEVSGFDVASAIRSMERSAPCRPRAYIAALTGLVSDKDRRAAFEAGVDEYVTKPATVRDLQSVIANWRIANGS